MNVFNVSSVDYEHCLQLNCNWDKNANSLSEKIRPPLVMHSSVWLKLIFAQLSLPPCNLGHKTILLQKVFFLFWFTKQTLSRLDLEPHFSVSSKCWQTIACIGMQYCRFVDTLLCETAVEIIGKSFVTFVYRTFL